MRALVFTPLLLAGCVTPQNCERAVTGLTVASDIIAVLEANGIAPEIATKLAPLLALGKVSVGVACARPA